MILTKDERKQVYQDWLNSETLTDEDGLIQLAETALLEKLRAGVELPEADVRIYRGFATHSTKQLLAYGAAQRLAGREQVLKEATDLDWTAIMCEGCLVTWENAETLGCHAVEHIRALAASPQEQI